MDKNNVESTLLGYFIAIICVLKKKDSVIITDCLSLEFFNAGLLVASIIGNNRPIFNKLLLIERKSSKEIAFNIAAAIYIWNPYYFNLLQPNSLSSMDLLFEIFKRHSRKNRHFIADQVIKYTHHRRGRGAIKPDKKLIESYISFVKTLFGILTSVQIQTHRHSLFLSLCSHQTCSIWKEQLILFLQSLPSVKSIPWTEEDIVYDFRFKPSKFEMIEIFLGHQIVITESLCRRMCSKCICKVHDPYVLERISSLKVLIILFGSEKRRDPSYTCCGAIKIGIQAHIEKYVVDCATESAKGYYLDENKLQHKKATLDLDFARLGYWSIVHGKEGFITKQDLITWNEPSTFIPLVAATLFTFSPCFHTDLVCLVLSYVVNSYVKEGQSIVEALLKGQLSSSRNRSQ